MFKMQKAHFFSILLWFPIVSISIGVALLLSLPLGTMLYDLGKNTFSANDDGFFYNVIHILPLILLVGLFMGFGQWIVINTKMKNTHSWILATLFGISFGSLVSFIILASIGEMLSLLSRYYYKIYDWIQIFGTITGAGVFTGICQWVSLKRKMADSLKWSLVTGLSFAIGSIFSTNLVNPQVDKYGFIIFSITIGLISGAFVEPLIIRPETQDSNQRIAI